jgi:hypothetical protein
MRIGFAQFAALDSLSAFDVIDDVSVFGGSLLSPYGKLVQRGALRSGSAAPISM